METTNNLIEEIEKSLEKLAANGEWAAWEYISAGWQVGSKKYFESNDFENGYGGIGGIKRKSKSLYGDVFYAAWYQFPSEYMNDEIEEANAKFIANAPKYVKYLLDKLKNTETTTITVTMDGETETDVYICDKCGEQFTTINRPYFCPNCGCRIVGEG